MNRNKVVLGIAVAAITLVGIMLQWPIMLQARNSAPEAARPVSAEADLNAQSEKGITPALSCFRCHDYAKFNATIPHELHLGMGLHCTGCHRMQAHHEMTLRGEACTGCHQLAMMKLSVGGMPARFDHAMHSGMFECGQCHMDVFPMRLNGPAMTMAEMQEGAYCGQCHAGDALNDCAKCHEM